jgi:hypothetical protein
VKKEEEEDSFKSEAHYVRPVDFLPELLLSGGRAASSSSSLSWYYFLSVHILINLEAVDFFFPLSLLPIRRRLV